MLFENQTIIVEELTSEMREWLNENYESETDFFITPNMVRYRYAGPNVPLSEQEKQQGHKIVFGDEEKAVAFKLRWL